MTDPTIRHRVEVDQRALIDKILARYATDYGAVRELIQNADDAGATEAGLRLEVAPNQTGLEEVHTVHVWNNGRPFSDTDWKRLRKIASGNPDEASVGLFGVGFFSVFSLTESPEVHSGKVKLRFVWDNSELSALESPLPVAQKWPRQERSVHGTLDRGRR